MTTNLYYNILFAVVMFLLGCVLISIAWYTIDVLLLTFAAILLAIFLRTLNSLIQSILTMPDSLSMTLVIGIIITIFTLITVLMTPIINEQIKNLSDDIPSGWDKFKQIFSTTFNLDSISTFYDKRNVQNLLPEGKTFVIQATNLFSTTFGLVGSVVVFIVMGVFLAYDPNTYKEGFIDLIPISKKKKVGNIIESITDILKGWIIGQMFSMMIVGVLTTLGLWFLSIPMALTLGLLSAILTFIPNIGPIISAVPAILVAFIQSPISALYVTVLYIAIQTIESYIITPFIQGKIIAQPAALVIFSQLIMGLLTGFLGLSLATPLLAAFSVLVQKVYTEK